MPSKNIDTRTLCAATAGLCLAVAAACVGTSGTEDGDALVLLETPSNLIVIQDDVEIAAFAEIDGLDPAAFAASAGIVIEDDDDMDDSYLEPAVASVEIDDAEEAPAVTRGQRLMAALSGSVASVDAVNTSVPSAPMVRAPSMAAPERVRSARPSSLAASSDDDDGRLASLTDTPKTSSVTSNRSPALTGFGKAEFRPVESLSADVIRTAIGRQLPKVRACYERQLKNNSGLRGRMVLSMSVQPSGDVSRASVKGDEVGDAELSSCVVRVVESFRFPAGTEAIAVEYPVNFKPSP